MKFKVYTQTKIEPKDQIYFKLHEDKGSIILTAVNKNGSEIVDGHILRINSKGLYLFSGINKHLGLFLDKNERVKINTLSII